LGQKAVPVLKGHARAKKTIIFEINCAGRRNVCMFNTILK
jgi:hypothetical protein